MAEVGDQPPDTTGAAPAHNGASRLAEGGIRPCLGPASTCAGHARVGEDANADVAATRVGAYAEPDQLRFAIATGMQTIRPTARLPPVARAVVVDATTQPGYVDQPLIVLDGALAGAATDGLALAAAAQVIGLEIAGFGGIGIRTDPGLFANGFESGVAVKRAAGAASNASVSLSVVRDNLGDGVRIDAGAGMTLTDTLVLRNRGRGIAAFGELTATRVEVALSGDHGVLVQSADPVELLSANVHGSGRHPAGATPNRAGLRVLRASDPAGLLLQGGEVSDNSGHGIALGDFAAQTGAVTARIEAMQIFANEVGIDVRQRDNAARRTTSTIVGNNVHDNRRSGIYFLPSFLGFTGPDGLAIAGNDVHHNAVTPAGACAPGVATQSAAQIVFEGFVAVDAPAAAACHPPGVDTKAECDRLNDPDDPLSNGVNNHCVWNGFSCAVAWDMGGSEGAGACGGSSNRVSAYVNDPTAPPETQKGVVAKFGALVRASRNTWGIGGPGAGAYADIKSVIETGNDCGSVSICP